MIYKGSIFVNDIIKKVFQLRMTLDLYQELGKKAGIKCDRNIFYNCLYKNSKFLNYKCEVVLKELILYETKDNKTKTEKLFNYLKEYLPKDVTALIEKEPQNIEAIIDLSISKFADDGTNEGEEKLNLDIKEISDLYINAIKYITSSNKKNGFQLFTLMIEKIIDFIAENENVKFLNKNKKNTASIKAKTISYKKIIPPTILLLIEQFNAMIKVKDSSNTYEELIELIFLNNQKILKWFIEDYMDNEIYFSVIESKSNELFYTSKDDEEIRVYNVDELKKIGWSMEDISLKTSELFRQTVPLRDDNTSDQKTKLAKMKYEPSSRKILLNKKNEIVGYWVFLPLFEEAFKLSKEGKLKTNDTNPSHIRLILPGETYNIEFGGVYLREDFRNYKGYKTLIFSIIDHFEALALDDIYINEIATKSSNNDGIGFITSLGLKFYKKHPDNKDISLFCGRVYDLLGKDYMKKYTLLRKLYIKKFED